MTETPPPYKPCGHDGTPYVEPRTGRITSYFIGYYQDPERRAFGPFPTREKAAAFARDHLPTPPAVALYEQSDQVRDISRLCPYTPVDARRPEQV